MTDIIVLTNIIAAATASTSYAEYVCDYYDSTAYICDTFAEIADSNTSIYYSDIIRYISEHVEEVNDAIEEFGWDGVGGDLYNAGQTAEYTSIQNELYSASAEIIAAYAADYIRHTYGAEEIAADMWDEIAAELETVDASDRWDTIRYIVDAVYNRYTGAEDDSDADDTDTADTMTA